MSTGEDLEATRQALMDQLALVVPELVPTKDVYLDHDWNSRGQFTDASIVELAESIRSTGLRDAILVRTSDKYPGYKYQTVYGHRRLAAHHYMQRPFIPAKITTLSEDMALLLNIKENLERVDVNFYNQAESIRRLIDMGYTLDTIKQSLKQSTKWIQQRIKLLTLGDQAQRLAAAGILKPAHVDRIMRLPNLSGRMKFLRELKDGHRKIDTGEHILKSIEKAQAKGKVRPNEQRSLQELTLMQQRVQAALGLRSPEAMTIAWTGGWISDDEYYDFVDSRATDLGRFFRRPVMAESAVG